MLGPRITLQLWGARTSVGAVDLLLAGLVLAGVLRERSGQELRFELLLLAALLLAGLFFLVSFLSERLRLWLARAGEPALPTLITLPTAHGPTLVEAGSVARSARGGLAGMGIDLAIGLIAVAVWLLLHGSNRRISDLAVVSAMAIGGSAFLRFVASPSLNGGRVIRWMLEYTVDDDDTAVRTTRWIGFLSGAVLFTLGVALLLRDGEASFWGVGLAATGIDVCALAAVGTRQTLWLQTANERTVGALLESQHAVVSASSSLDEMIAVLTVDGPRAVALVRDDAGLPVGIMQFQQMRSAIGRKGAHVTIGDVMIPLAELPLVERETSILDATHLLLERGSPAVRYLGADGKMHIATAADLGVPRGTT